MCRCNAKGGGGGACKPSARVAIAVVSPTLACLCRPSVAAPAPAAAPTDPTRASAAAITQPDCYAKPQQERCRIYQQSDAASRADIEKLCSAIPSMVGCTLWQQCISGAANGSYCQPFSALGSICSANTAQAGCQRWAALCSTPGSVVQQCITGRLAGGGIGGCICAAAAWAIQQCPPRPHHAPPPSPTLLAAPLPRPHWLQRRPSATF